MKDNEWTRKRINYHLAMIGKEEMYKGRRKHSETVAPSKRIAYHKGKIEELRKELGDEQTTDF